MDDDDDVMAPMVDALTGAMAAILLVTIFMMISTVSDVAESIKSYGKESLYKNKIILNDVFNREPPILELKSNKLIFFKSYKLTEDQIKTLTNLFSTTPPIKLMVYSNDTENVISYNTLFFLKEVGLNKIIDSIEMTFLPERNKGITEFSWEFK